MSLYSISTFPLATILEPLLRVCVEFPFSAESSHYKLKRRGSKLRGRREAEGVISQMLS